MNRRQVVSIFFIALLLGILAGVFYVLSPFVTPIFWGALLAFAFYPLYEKCLKLFRNNAGLASASTTLLILLAFLPLVIFLVTQAAKEAGHFFEWVTGFVQRGEAEMLVLRFRELPWIQKIEAHYPIAWDTLMARWKEWSLDSAGTLGHLALKNATLLTKNVLSGMFNLFLTFFLVFFFLKDGDAIYRFIYEITPLEENNKQAIFKQLSDTFSATLRGQFLTALAQAATLGVVFWFLRLPLPVFFAAVTFIAAMIPVFGAATVWVPFAVYLGMTQQFKRAALLLVLGVFGISGMDNILKPMLIGHKTKLPYPLLFLGILGGLQVYGFVGIFVAPALFSLFFVLVKIYREKFSEPA